MVTNLRKSLFVVLMGCGAMLPAGAAEVARHAGQVLSDVEIQAEMAVLAPALREAVQGSEKSAENLAADLITRRTIAARAVAEGVDKDSVVAARVRLAAERALYEAYMEYATAKAVDPALVERLAREEYRAYPEKFRAGEQVRARHILIAACECAPEQARAKADAVLARVKAGESFEAVAEQESDDPGSAKKGGDLGFFARGKMVKPFEEAAFALSKPGEISDLVQSQFGYHIIRLEERKPAASQSFDEVKDALVESIATRMKAAERVKIIGPIREPGVIEIDAEALGKAVAAGS